MEVYNLAASLQDEVGQKKVREVTAMYKPHRGVFEGARVTGQGGWW